MEGAKVNTISMVSIWLFVLLLATLYDHMFNVGLFVYSSAVSHVFMFFMFFMFYVGLLIVRLCFKNDIVLFVDWLYCIDLFSCIAASVFDKLTCLYLLTLFRCSQSNRDADARDPVNASGV